MSGVLLAILALFAVLAFVVARVDGLTFLGPSRTAALAGAAGGYCEKGCRLADGTCPLTSTHQRADHCPLWKFVAADGPTEVTGSPFESVAA